MIVAAQTVGFVSNVMTSLFDAPNRWIIYSAEPQQTEPILSELIELLYDYLVTPE